MKKTLYSLILSDDVVREVDALAHRMGQSRSGLVNEILAEYVSVQTPERRINDIFRAMEELVAPSPELVPFFAQNSTVMSLKSSLCYKYRPTVKYEVELDLTANSLGAIAVIFRTQSAELISAMTEFFRLWTKAERECLENAPECSLYEGRFVREIGLPYGKTFTADEIAGAICDYIRFFDAQLKGYLGGEFTEKEVETNYRGDALRRRLLI